jgi:hypothetical protein
MKHCDALPPLQSRAAALKGVTCNKKNILFPLFVHTNTQSNVISLDVCMYTLLYKNTVKSDFTWLLYGLSTFLATEFANMF